MGGWEGVRGRVGGTVSPRPSPASGGTGFQPVPFDRLQALWHQRSGRKDVLYDLGVKFNLIHCLKARGLEVLSPNPYRKL